MRRRSSLLMQQQLFILQQQHWMINSQQRRRSMPSEMGFMLEESPLQQRQLRTPFFRPVAWSNPNVDDGTRPPPHPQPHPHRPVPLALTGTTTLANPAPDLNEFPPRSEASEGGTPSGSAPKPSLRLQEKRRASQGLDASPSPSPLFPNVLAEKATQQCVHRSAPGMLPESISFYKENASSPPSFVKRIGMLFKTSTTHRRPSREHKPQEHSSRFDTVNTKEVGANEKNKNPLSMQSGHGNSVDPVMKLSATEVVKPKDSCETALDGVDTAPTARRNAKKHRKPVPRTLSFFNRLRDLTGNHRNDDTEEGYSGGHSCSPLSDDYTYDSTTLDGSNSPFMKTGDSQALGKVARKSAAANKVRAPPAERDRKGKEDGNSTQSAEVESTDAVSGDESDEHYSAGEEGSNGSSDHRSFSDNSEDDSEKRLLAMPLSPGTEYTPSSFFYRDTVETIHPASPLPDVAREFCENATERPQLAAAEHPHTASLPYFLPDLQLDGCVPRMRSGREQIRQTASSQDSSMMSPILQKSQHTQRTVSSTYSSNSEYNLSGMLHSPSSVEGTNHVTVSPLCTSVPSPNSSRTTNTHCNFAVNSDMSPMAKRFPASSRRYPRSMAQYQPQ
ncbi:hypothetical protein ABL78_3406 [Leptomonas seymouri]|uniref:Uncharacterized protein n=1 Tax=Leptomonas seymouri TaxID=5684 RepID=A0A0N1IL08_LEPSE|nr:hypothetical protein ABL78_3406 [Leptomonas seymouri]|eukprot:KPI87495.1 hypothetical protein ABL78_3406 [Leptomonas seymouri]